MSNTWRLRPDRLTRALQQGIHCRQPSTLRIPCVHTRLPPACPERYAGCSFEAAAAAEAGEGQLLVKGMRAVWRQSAPFVQNTLLVRVAGRGGDDALHAWQLPSRAAGRSLCAYTLPCHPPTPP